MSYKAIGTLMAEDQLKMERLFQDQDKQNEEMYAGLDELQKQLASINTYVSEIANSIASVKLRLTTENEKSRRAMIDLIDDSRRELMP